METASVTEPKLLGLTSEFVQGLQTLGVLRLFVGLQMLNRYPPKSTYFPVGNHPGLQQRNEISAGDIEKIGCSSRALR